MRLLWVSAEVPPLLLKFQLVFILKCWFLLWLRFLLFLILFFCLILYAALLLLIFGILLLLAVFCDILLRRVIIRLLGAHERLKVVLLKAVLFFYLLILWNYIFWVWGRESADALFGAVGPVCLIFSKLIDSIEKLCILLNLCFSCIVALWTWVMARSHDTACDLVHLFGENMVAALLGYLNSICLDYIDFVFFVWLGRYYDFLLLLLLWFYYLVHLQVYLISLVACRVQIGLLGHGIVGAYPWV